MTAKQKSIQIEVRDLCKRFEDHVVLDQLTLSVNPGEIFVLMGPSGTGKSVFLKLLAGLDRPTSGSIHINGIPLDEVKKEKTFVLGLVFQAGALFNSMSVFDNLALYFREHAICDEEEIANRIARVLKLLNLEFTERLMPSDLSGGMKKRVALARGLLMQPDVLLFDEPTSELDPITAASIIELIGYVNRTLNITTVVVSHDLTLAKSIADHIGVLQNGKIDEIYTKETLLNSKNAFVQNFLNPNINIQHPNFGTLLS
ncbi:MAG: ABC transporter ATP-binding protein [bacterium]